MGVKFNLPTCILFNEINATFLSGLHKSLEHQGISNKYRFLQIMSRFIQFNKITSITVELNFMQIC